MGRIVIENPCNGIGDAVLFCWTLHTLRAAGVDALLNVRRNHEVFDIFGVPREWRTEAPGIAQHPPKGVRGSAGWLESWLRGYAGIAPPAVCPRYVEHPEDARWADRLWSDRDAATSVRGRRVLVFPDVVWKPREWAKSCFGILSHRLMAEGWNVVVMTPGWDPNHAFPWAIGGCSLRAMAALIARADVVVANDSGPAHFAGTLAVPTVAVCGPSDPRLFFSHYPTLFPVTSATVPCAGCNFEYERGYRSYCDAGCAALASIGVEQVAREVERAHGSRDGLVPSCAAPLLVRRAYRTEDETICRDVFAEDCYRVADLPYPVESIVDVGAHVGAATARMLARYPMARAACVEMEAGNFALLERNFASEPRATLFHAALTYEEGELVLNSTVWPGSDNTGGSYLARTRGDARYRAEPAPGLLTLEDVLGRMDWERVDVLKLDCEGSEHSILEDGPMERVGVAVGEWHDRSRFFDLVRRRFADWSFDVLRDDGESGLFRLAQKRWWNL